MRAKLLVGELDLNGLIGAFELYSLCHRLVSRACAPRLFVFIHKNNQLTNGGASPTALLRLRGALRLGVVSADTPCRPLCPNTLSRIAENRSSRQSERQRVSTKLDKYCHYPTL